MWIKTLDKFIEKTWLQKRRLVIGIIGLIGLFAILWIFFFSNLSQYRKINAKDIRIAEVSYKLYNDNIPIRGQVMPLETFYLTATEGGIVDKIYVEDGQLVSRQQALVDLSNPNLQLRSIESEAQVGQQITALQQQELGLLQTDLRDQQELNRLKWEIDKQSAKLNRIKQLDKNYISQQELEQESMTLYSLTKNYELLEEFYNKNKLSYQLQISKIKDSIRYLEDNLNYTRANLRNLKIKTPIDGRLTAFNLEVGQSLNPGERIGQVDNPSNFKIVAEIQEFYQPRLQPGQSAKLHFDGQDYKLILKKLYPQIQEGHIRIDLVFADSPPSNINRGQNLPVQLEIGGEEEALCIPQDSFIRDTGGNWIFVLGEQHRAHKRFITTGRQNGELIEVIDGLQPGERVITSAYTNFSNELALNIEN